MSALKDKKDAIVEKDAILVGEGEPSRGRIQYAEDVEAGPRPGRLARRDSNASSMSIRSISRRRTIEPAKLLPIEYRTASFHVDETHKQREKLKHTLERLKPHIGSKGNKSPEKGKKGIAPEFSDLDWHTISEEEIFQRLSSSPVQGLSSDQVTRKTKEFGPNAPSPPPSRWFRKTMGYLFGGFGPILLVACILVFIAWKPLGNPPQVANLALGIVLAIVFALQAAFSFLQDWTSSRVMSSISTMLPAQCLVIRDGNTQSIAGSQIVPGDVLVLRMGDKVSADVRFFECSTDVKFDRSILTGESQPLRGSVDSSDQNILETTCIGMAGTNCVSGTAKGLVFATGDNTVFGRIAKLTSTPKQGLTTLEREILYFVGVIVLLMLVNIIIVIIAWGSWLNRDHHGWITVPGLIIECVSVAVAFIPEGLPIAVTASLTIMAKIMKKNNILCKSLKTVETLGAVTVICSDKTGTLTKNEMRVTDFSVAKMSEAAPEPRSIDTSEKYDFTPEGLASQTSLAQLSFVAGLCNEAEFDPTTQHLPIKERRANGNATDQAVLRFAEGICPLTTMRECWRTQFHLTFNSKNKYMMKVLAPAYADGKEHAPTGAMITIKGAPDILLGRCTQFLKDDGQAGNMRDVDRRRYETIKDQWSSKGKRVILLARKQLPSRFAELDPKSHQYEDALTEEAKSGLELLGMLGIVDPPREEIPEVVRTLRGAGIKIHMVTGDFKLTAQAIAKECGIITNPMDRVDNVSALSDGRNSPSSSSSRKKPIKEEPIGDMVDQNRSFRSIVVSGPEMAALEDEDWDALCAYDEIVFARTTPEQKLRIVKELQKRDETVGMTGDGVNDAPSLKSADIGIAMGSGSEVAMEAADMVLLDSFSAIVEAVKYGRVAYDNLKKTICYLLPAGSFSEFWPVFTNVYFGMPQILSSFLMIIICCITDCAAATVIAYEKPEADVLLRRPRNAKKDRLVNFKLILHAYGFIGVLESLCSFAMSYWYAQRKGYPFSTLWFGFGFIPKNLTQSSAMLILNEASSIYFINLVVMQWFNLMSVRTRRLSILQHPPILRRATSNYWLFPAMAFGLVIGVIFLYIPSLQNTLGTSKVPAANYFLPMAFGMGILLLDETRKYFVRKYPKGFLARIAW